MITVLNLLVGNFNLEWIYIYIYIYITIKYMSWEIISTYHYISFLYCYTSSFTLNKLFCFLSLFCASSVIIIESLMWFMSRCRGFFCFVLDHLETSDDSIWFWILFFVFPAILTICSSFFSIQMAAYIPQLQLILFLFFCPFLRKLEWRYN